MYACIYCAYRYTWERSVLKNAAIPKSGGWKNGTTMLKKKNRSNGFLFWGKRTRDLQGNRKVQWLNGESKSNYLHDRSTQSVSAWNRKYSPWSTGSLDQITPHLSPATCLQHELFRTSMNIYSFFTRFGRRLQKTHEEKSVKRASRRLRSLSRSLTLFTLSLSLLLPLSLPLALSLTKRFVRGGTQSRSQYLSGISIRQKKVVTPFSAKRGASKRTPFP